MKWNFLYQICLQNPWLGLLCILSSTEFVEPPPPPPEQNSWVRHWFWLRKPEMLNVVSYMTMISLKDFSLYFAIISRLWLLAANVEW